MWLFERDLKPFKIKKYIKLFYSTFHELIQISQYVVNLLISKE